VHKNVPVVVKLTPPALTSPIARQDSRTGAVEIGPGPCVPQGSVVLT
jgi:hypothetical protein